MALCALHPSHSRKPPGQFIMYEAPVFLPTDQIQVEFVLGRSVSSLAHENTDNEPNSAAYKV